MGALVGASWLVVLLCVLLWPGSAGAHPFAASHFEARTDGDAIEFSFRFDATAMMELFDAHASGGKPRTKRRLSDGEAFVLAYLDDEFGVRNGSTSCERQAPTRLEYAARIDKLVVDVRYECGEPLSVVSLRSALFVDEETPHQVIGSFRHLRATERYFFTGGERQATIRLDALRQGGRSFSTLGPGDGARYAQPPPGAFDGPGKRADAPKRTAGLEPTATPTAADASSTTRDPPAAATESIPEAQRAGFWTFLGQGLIHIFGGFDHILFVLTLLLVVRDWKELGWIITSFTIAHSVTLAAVALELITVSPRLVEPAIAATIVYVALENVLRDEPEARPGVTFGFGLIHGLGFGGALSELGLRGGELAGPLVGFNLGVELGQLAIVLPLFPLVLWAREREPLFVKTRIAAGVGVALLAAWWFVERAFGLG